MLLLALTLLAAVPRFANLDRLSFYGDEETTAFPARALAEGRGAVMPSGMEYRRGLTVTWMAAGAARLLGTEREVSYRLPSALLGTLTVPLLFLFGRRYLGAWVALVAAVALSLSEWHLVYSRMARMYVPLVFFYLAAGYATWRWAERGGRGRLALAGVAFTAAALTHSLAVFAVFFAVIPVLLPGPRWRTGPGSLLVFAGVAVVGARLFDRLVVDPPFRAWTALPPPEAPAGEVGSWAMQAPTAPLWPAWLVGLSGVMLGIWAGVRALRSEAASPGSPRLLGMVGLGGLALGLLSVGQIWGAAAFGLLYLSALAGDRRDALRLAVLPLSIAFLLGSVQVVAHLLDAGAAGGLRQALVFPFPYPLYLFRAFPLPVLLFGGVCAWAVWTPWRREEFGLRALLLAGFLPILAVGVFRGWSHLRFLLPAHPFLLLVASAALVAVLRWIASRLPRTPPSRSAAAVALVLVLLGAFSGHGLPAAVNVVTLRHGEPVSESLHQEAFRPDHETAGLFVRHIREAGDVVVAEDPLEQRWYAGSIDGWFRSYRDARQFLYRAPDGNLRDMYVESRLLPGTAALDSVTARTEGRLWFITSGETVDQREHYLDPAQRVWLDSLERVRKPAFLARDSVTKVFCLNCPDGSTARIPVRDAVPE